MNALDRPDDYADRLEAVVADAIRTDYWLNRLGSERVRSISDFTQLPVTSVDEYRQQPFGSLVTDPGAIEWIPGPWLGQSPRRVPVAEGSDDARIRVELMSEALSGALPDYGGSSTGVVLATERRRYFGAEISATLVRMGVPAHLVVESATDRIEQLLIAFQPALVVALVDDFEPETLPESVTGIITVGQASSIQSMRHVDLCIQNELGVLGSSTGPENYRMNHHRFHFEESIAGSLVVTPYFIRVQPVVRLDTGLPTSVIH